MLFRSSPSSPFSFLIPNDFLSPLKNENSSNIYAEKKEKSSSEIFFSPNSEKSSFPKKDSITQECSLLPMIVEPSSPYEIVKNPEVVLAEREMVKIDETEIESPKSENGISKLMSEKNILRCIPKNIPSSQFNIVEETDDEMFLFPAEKKSSNSRKYEMKREIGNKQINEKEVVSEVVESGKEIKEIERLCEKIEFFGNAYENLNENSHENENENFLDDEEESEMTILSDKTILSREEMNEIKLELRLQREQLKQKELLEIEINNLKYQKKNIEIQNKMENNFHFMKMNKQSNVENNLKIEEEMMINIEIEEERENENEIKLQNENEINNIIATVEYSKNENQILETEIEEIEINIIENKTKNIIENKTENIIENKTENIVENKTENIIENKIEIFREESIEERIIRMQKKEDEKLNFETLYSAKNDVLTPLPIKRPISLNRIPSIRMSMAMRKANEKNEKNLFNDNIFTINNLNNYNSDNFSSDGENRSENGSVKNSSRNGSRSGSRSGSPSLLKRKNSFQTLTSFLNPKKNEKNSMSKKITKKYEMSHFHGKMKLNYREKPFDGNGILHFLSTEGGRSTYANAHMSGSSFFFNLFLDSIYLFFL